MRLVGPVAAIASLLLVMINGAQSALAQGLFIEVVATPDPAIKYEVLLSDPTIASDIASVDVADDGRVFFAEMTGAIKVLDPDGTVGTLVSLPTGVARSRRA